MRLAPQFLRAYTDRIGARRGAVIPTPWEGRWSRYDLRDRMRIPLEGEVAWMLPEGQEPYWRGRIANLTYEFVR